MKHPLWDRLDPVSQRGVFCHDYNDALAPDSGKPDFYFCGVKKRRTSSWKLCMKTFVLFSFSSIPTLAMRRSDKLMAFAWYP
jgi:hypothetical protein